MKYKGFEVAEDGELLHLSVGCSACTQEVQSGHFACGCTPDWVEDDDNVTVLYDNGWKAMLHT